MKKNRAYYIRRTHRFLGVFIGVQFLGWTLSGLFFSWTNIDDIHGDHLRQSASLISVDIPLVSPQPIIEQLKDSAELDKLISIKLVNILDVPHYQIEFSSALHAHHDHNKYKEVVLANALSGEIRAALNQEEAIVVAQRHITSSGAITQVEYLEEVGSHHEYRSKPLPAWAISFDDPACTVYVSAHLGTFQSIRHDQWRVFDFLWMFHTMDFAGRDNFNNWLLRIVSIFALLTIISGFTLFAVSGKPMFKRRAKA